MTLPPLIVITNAGTMYLGDTTFFVYEGTRGGKPAKWVALYAWDFRPSAAVVVFDESDEEFQAFSL